MERTQPPAAERLELGAYTQLYRGSPFPVALERLARAGFHAIGVSNRHAGAPLITAETTLREVKIIGRQIAVSGLAVRLIGGFPSHAADPASQVRRAIDIAAALDCPFVTSHGPSPYVDHHYGQRKRAMVQFREAAAYVAALRETAPMAARAGITIVLKPHSGLTGTGADLADLVRLIDHPAVRVCYDAGNIAFFEGLVPEQDVTACAEYVRVVAIKDHRGPPGNENVPIPGEGIVDHANVFRALLAAGFAGPCIIERIDGHETADAMDTALARARVNLELAIAAAYRPPVA